MTGLLGKGTAYLPSSVTHSETYTSTESGKSQTRGNTDYASYTLNSDGTIRNEKFYGTKSYTYVTADAVSDKTKAPAIKAPWQNNGRKLRMKDLFVPRKLHCCNTMIL